LLAFGASELSAANWLVVARTFLSSVQRQVAI
jgi:hypothetical protein